MAVGLRRISSRGSLALGTAAVVVDLVVAYEPERVVLTVENAVRGVSAGLPGAGAGLVGMRERAVLLGGEFHAGAEGDR